MDPHSSSSALTKTPSSTLRKSSSIDGRRSTRSQTSFSSSLKSPSTLQHILSLPPKAAESLVNVASVAVDMTRNRTRSISSREGLQALKDCHDEAVRKKLAENAQADSQGESGKSFASKGGWFGSDRKVSRIKSVSPLSSEVYNAVDNSGGSSSATGAKGDTSETSSPDSTIDLETPTDLPVAAIPVKILNGKHAYPSPPRAMQSLQPPEVSQCASPSKGSWFMKKDPIPPAISITNPTPTNSPSRPSSYSVFIAHSPPYSSPLSASSTRDTSAPANQSRIRNFSRQSSGEKEKHLKETQLLNSSDTSSSPRSIPNPKTRPSPYALSPTATASVDSHVPTLVGLTPPGSPITIRAVVPAPAIPVSTTSELSYDLSFQRILDEAGICFYRLGCS